MKRYHEEWGYRFVWPPTVGNLTPRHQALMDLAARAEQYLHEQQRDQHEHSDRPGHFGNPTESRRDAFQ